MKSPPYVCATIACR